MKFEEAIATSSCMFCKPLLFAKDNKKEDDDFEDSVKNIKFKKRKNRDSDEKYVDELIHFKSRLF